MRWCARFYWDRGGRRRISSGSEFQLLACVAELRHHLGLVGPVCGDYRCEFWVCSGKYTAKVEPNFASFPYLQYFTTFKIAGKTESTYLTFVRNSRTRKQVAYKNNSPGDPEKQAGPDGSLSVSSQTVMITEKPAQQDAQLIKNTSVFTWRNLRYTVNVPGGTRLLLDNVNGFIKPGTLGALMGSSGAGKTTLLDVLAQRKTEGTIEGEVHVDGRPLPVAFQRSAGYCEQLGKVSMLRPPGSRLTLSSFGQMFTSH